MGAALRFVCDGSTVPLNQSVPRRNDRTALQSFRVRSEVPAGMEQPAEIAKPERSSLEPWHRALNDRGGTANRSEELVKLRGPSRFN